MQVQRFVDAQREFYFHEGNDDRNAIDNVVVS